MVMLPAAVGEMLVWLAIPMVSLETPAGVEILLTINTMLIVGSFVAFKIQAKISILLALLLDVSPVLSNFSVLSSCSSFPMCLAMERLFRAGQSLRRASDTTYHVFFNKKVLLNLHPYKL